MVSCNSDECFVHSKAVGNFGSQLELEKLCVLLRLRLRGQDLLVDFLRLTSESHALTSCSVSWARS